MKNLFTLGSALIAFTLMTGCSSKVQDPTALSQADAENKSYLARYLLEPEYRNRLVHSYEKKPGIIVPSPGAHIYTNMVVESFEEGWGDVAGAGVIVVGMFMGDGSLDTITQAYIPADKNIETQDEANDYIEEIVMQRMDYLGQALGGEVKCVAGCDGGAKLFEIGISNSKVLSDFGDKFDKILVKLDIQDVAPVPEKHSLSYAIGKDVAWATPFGNSLGLEVWGGIKDKQYKIEFDKNGSPTPYQYVRDNVNGLVKSVYATVTKSEGLIWGTDHRRPYAVSVDGTLYEAATHQASDFVWRLYPEELYL